VCSRANCEAPEPRGQERGLGSSGWTQPRGGGVPPSRGRPGPPAFGCSSSSGRWLEGQGARLQRKNLCPSTLVASLGWEGNSARNLSRVRAHSSLTIVQLSSWPQGARPEIGRLVWCRDRVSRTSWAFPTPGVVHLPRSLGKGVGWPGGASEPACLPTAWRFTDHWPFSPPGTEFCSPPGAQCRHCLLDWAP